MREAGTAFQSKADLCLPHPGMGQHSPRLGERAQARNKAGHLSSCGGRAPVFLWRRDLGATKMVGMVKEQSEWPSVLLPTSWPMLLSQSLHLPRRPPGSISPRSSPSDSLLVASSSYLLMKEQAGVQLAGPRSALTSGSHSVRHTPPPHHRI